MGVEQLRRILKINEEYSIDVVDSQVLIKTIHDKVQYFVDRVTAVIGTIDYNEFVSIFPEIHNCAKISCSNVDNIRINVPQLIEEIRPDSMKSSGTTETNDIVNVRTKMKKKSHQLQKER